MLTYQEQLLHPKWQKRKAQILTRDKYTCKGCSSTDNSLQVHHLIYFNHLLAWEYPDDLLVTLCVSCHPKEKQRPELEKSVATSFQINGFLFSDLVCLATLLFDKKFSKPLLKKLRKNQNG